jgi:hypothetical protein
MLSCKPSRIAAAASSFLLLLLLLLLACIASAASLTAVPPWPATYLLGASTITMQCNGSGYSSAWLGSAFGIVSYDWSNDKKDWAKKAPMDCEERLLKQARATKRAGGNSTGGNSTRVFVYRNLVKALPWFSTVRKILDDPAYAGFFLKFDPTKQDSDLHVPRCAPENPHKCSPFYHDQEQVRTQHSKCNQSASELFMRVRSSVLSVCASTAT